MNTEHNDIKKKLIFSLCRYVNVVMSLCRKCEPGFSKRSCNKHILLTELDPSLYIYLINQARGPYWEKIGPRSWQYGPSAARSVQQRPRADILPVRSRASLVNKRFITRLKKAKTCKDTSAGSFGTMPGPILREYWTGNRAF